MSKLRRCPFCGGTATVHDWKENGLMPYSTWAVECDDCGADGGWWPSRSSAVENWNRREGMDDEKRMAEAEIDRNAEKDNSSITKELRAWASQWWRVHLSDDGTMSISSAETDDPTPTVEHIIIDMANRIDFMHAHEMTMARGEAIQYLESNASDQYVKLPVDAVGVPILKGDKMDYRCLFRFTADWFEYMGGDLWSVHDAEGNSFEPGECRHRPLERWEQILEEAKAASCRRLAHEDE